MTDDTADHEESNHDASLLGRVVRGDLSALELLFARYQRPIYQLALGIARDAETAEEVLQDTFYRLYTNAAKLDATLPLMPWLYRVAANLAYNQARRRMRWNESFHTLAERLLDPDLRSPEYVAERRELQEIVHATLEELSSSHRAVLVLHYLHDYSIIEIAGILDCPEGTVKSRLHHARKILKERIQQRYGGTTLLPDQL